MARSDIQWCTHTWNPVIGCTKVPVDGSAQKYTEPFNVVKELPNRLDDPAKFPKGSTVFLCSQGDLFHENVTFEFIFEVFISMIKYDSHTYKILTKRPERVIEFENWVMKKYISLPIWRKHIQLGTSVGSMLAIERVDYLIRTAAKIKYLSCEPLLGPLDLTSYLDKIDQVITGGESIMGRKHDRLREMDTDWAREIRDQCLTYNTPFFFKQHGNRRDPDTGKMISKKATGELLDGVEWKQSVELEVLN